MLNFFRKTPPKPEPAAATPESTARTILIVDDNPAFRGMLKSMLKMRGYNPIVALNPLDGLKLASEVKVDAALVDFNMPEIDGLEFSRKLLAQSKLTGREIPTWLMTGELNPEVSKRISEVGALQVVRKPFNSDDLCAKLEAEFERRGSSPSKPA